MGPEIRVKDANITLLVFGGFHRGRLRTQNCNNMDQAEIQILDEELSRLSKEISDPEIIAANIRVFNEVDKQRIKREKLERSDVHGVHELISRLKKRGPKAFRQFLESIISHEETYIRLRDKAIARGLLMQEESEHAPVQADERSSSDIVSRGPIIAASAVSTSPPSNSEERSNFSRNSLSESAPANSGHECGVNAACSFNTDGCNSTLKRVNNNNFHEEKPFKPQGPGTLLKDIQVSLKSKIVQNMIDDPLSNDWRGLAGEAGFTVEESDKLKLAKNPMEALFTWMMQNQHTISYLINNLKKIGRHDIITIITEYGYGEDSISDENVDEIMQEENHPGPSSESDLKESKEHKKGSHKLSQEATDGNDDEEGLTATTPLSEIPEDDVFIEEIKGKALLLGVDQYQNLPKLQELKRKVFELKYTIKIDDTDWDVKTVKGSVLKEVCRYLDTVNRNDVCFIYIAGHTVQINGENYLLPMDVGTDFTAADIMECSLNINQFLKELTQRDPLMLMVFIDGAHYSDVTFGVDSVLPGLAPMVPPPRSVIVYPCQPGHVRPMEETLSFVKSIKKVLKGQSVTPTILLSELKQRYPSTFVLSLSPKSILPLYTNIQGKGPTIKFPSSDTPRYSLIFVDDMIAGDSRQQLLNDAEHLKASLTQLEWQVTHFVKSECEDIRGTVRERFITGDLVGNEMKVVMIYFIGFQSKDKRSLVIDQQSSVNIKWVIDIMCGHICGPKVLIVDDPSSQPLDFATPLPPDVLICVPLEREPNNRSAVERDSFTLNLAQNLSAKPEGKLLNIIKTTAVNWKYQRVDSNLFYA